MAAPQSRDNLATRIRALPAVTALGELWQQRTADGETDTEYWAFLDWLDGGTARGAPGPKWLPTAGRFEWAQRAAAFERNAELQRASAGGLSPEQQITNNLRTMLQIETAKLVRQAGTTDGSVAPLRELVATAGFIRDMQKTAIQEGSQNVDLSKYTVDEIKTILAAQALLRRGQGGQK